MSGTVGETTLTVAQLARHEHEYEKMTTGRDASGTSNYIGRYYETTLTTVTGDSQPHTHSLSGTSGDADSLPPYYALALIMRIA